MPTKKKFHEEMDQTNGSDGNIVNSNIPGDAAEHGMENAGEPDSTQQQSEIAREQPQEVPGDANTRRKTMKKPQTVKKAKKVKTVSGTKEWSKVSANCVNGCSHDCRYCYARYNAVDFHHQILRDDWKIMKVREHDVKKKHKKYNGTVMFPTTHDITPEVLEPCLRVIRKLVESGNSVLIVSKPHFECIREICKVFQDSKEALLFRFTIGCDNDDILRYWEPGAPCYEERLKCLKYAYSEGFATSVSVEPMLDANNISRHVQSLIGYVTDAIWIGKLNNPNSRFKVADAQDKIEIARIKNEQNDDNIRNIYNSLKNDKRIKWKESIKKIVGIPVSTIAGEDS